jgi:hypothetical protein
VISSRRGRIGGLQVPADPAVRRGVSPPIVLEAYVGIDLDDEQRLRRCVVHEIAGQLSEPTRRDPSIHVLRPWQQRSANRRRTGRSVSAGTAPGRGDSRRAGHRLCATVPVGFQNPAAACDQRFQAAGA